MRIFNKLPSAQDGLNRNHEVIQPPRIEAKLQEMKKSELSSATSYIVFGRKDNTFNTEL